MSNGTRLGDWLNKRVIIACIPATRLINRIEAPEQEQWAPMPHTEDVFVPARTYEPGEAPEVIYILHGRRESGGGGQRMATGKAPKLTRT